MRNSATQSIDLTVMASHAGEIHLTWDYCGGTLTASRKRLERRLLVNSKTASFFQDCVPGWNGSDFKGNFCASCTTGYHESLGWP